MPRLAAAVPALCWVLLLNALAVASASAYVTVGSGGCNFTDLQTAINSSPDNSEFHVVSSYQGKPIKFQNKTLRIYGGYADCTGTTLSTSYSALDGSLDSGTKPVLQIDGQVSLDLRRFTLFNGHNSGNAGGGIRFFSSGTAGHVELHDVVIELNRSDIGGGIFYNGGASPGPDDLFLYDNTQVFLNTANHAGGGIRLEGHARLIAESPQTWIASNTADPTFADDGKGGGVQLLDESTASIGSPGYFGLAVIYNNKARNGGGIDINDDGIVRLFTTQPGQPARVEFNTALFNGGGVYLRPKTLLGGGGFIPTLCGYGYGINQNTAADGAAIYDDEDSSFGGASFGGRIDLTRQNCGGLPAHADCVPGSACNTIDDNTALQSGGSAVHATGEAQTSFEAEDFEMRRNSASHLLNLLGDGQTIALTDCLIADNDLSDSGVLLDANGEAQIDSCTLTNNTLHGNFQLIVNQGMSLTRSILWQAGSATVLLSGSGHVQLSDDVTNVLEFAGIAGSTIVNTDFADPLFVNPAGDFHLLSASPAIDRSSAGPATDLDGNLRGVPLLRPASAFDAGAFELQKLAPCSAPDVIFCNRFEP